MSGSRGSKREKIVRFRVTNTEWMMIRGAAEKRGVNVSQYASRLVLGEAVGKAHKADGEVVELIEKFKRLFAEAMRMSLRGELTAQRFDALVERVGGEG